ncbi:hypothetical protein F4777DRAFT_580117 [Nemania sp. FL0916]|nr:hypothetical protein F4777DRAFT_580117 [Nemania sp. FL0916]
MPLPRLIKNSRSRKVPKTTRIRDRALKKRRVRAPPEEAELCLQFIPQDTDESATLWRKSITRVLTLLSIISLSFSLSSSLVLELLMASSSGWGVQQTVLGSLLPNILNILPSDLGAILPVDQVTIPFQIFLASMLIFGRTRKTDKHREEVISVVMLLGMSLKLFAVLGNPYTVVIGQEISIMPFLISLGAITSAVLHSVCPSLQ